MRSLLLVSILMFGSTALAEEWVQPRPVALATELQEHLVNKCLKITAGTPTSHIKHVKGIYLKCMSVQYGRIHKRVVTEQAMMENSL